MNKWADIRTTLIVWTSEQIFARHLLYAQQYIHTSVQIFTLSLLYEQVWRYTRGTYCMNMWADVPTVLIVWTSDQLFLWYYIHDTHGSYCMNKWADIRTTLIVWTSEQMFPRCLLYEQVSRCSHGAYCLNTGPIILMVLHTWHTRFLLYEQVSRYSHDTYCMHNNTFTQVCKYSHYRYPYCMNKCGDFRTVLLYEQVSRNSHGTYCMKKWADVPTVLIVWTSDQLFLWYYIHDTNGAYCMNYSHSTYFMNKWADIRTVLSVVHEQIHSHKCANIHVWTNVQIFTLSIKVSFLYLIKWADVHIIFSPKSISYNKRTIIFVPSLLLILIPYETTWSSLTYS